MSTFIQTLDKSTDSLDLETYLKSHLTALDLIEQFKIMLENKLHNTIKVLTQSEKERLEHLINECEGYMDSDIEVVNDD